MAGTSARVAFKFKLATLLAVLRLGACSGGDAVGAAPYAPWAHSHWVWPGGGDTQADTLAFVKSFNDRNLSVGAVDIDSGWATCYNNFDIDKTFFPDMAGFVEAEHAEGVRVILWMTSMINTECSTFNESQELSYVIRDATNKSAVMKWWHGAGGLLDYSYPAARAWWEAQMDRVLKFPNGALLDGFKTDGAEPYMIELLFPQSFGGPITFQEYTNWYYGPTFNYTRSHNPEALIMSRPVDSYPIGFNLSAFLAFSPKYTMFSGGCTCVGGTRAGLWC